MYIEDNTLISRFRSFHPLRFEYIADLIRIYLGIGLLIRGFIYVGGDGRSILFELINRMEMSWAIPYVLGHYIIMSHIVGGLFMVLGIFSRFVTLLNIPILLGAVLFIHGGDALLRGGQELEFSLLVLILLVLTAVAGPGRLSMDVSVFGRVRRNS